MTQPPASRRWLPRPQFSLRLLFLAMTAFAIGFPLWYRWPIEEVTLEYPRISAKLGSKTVQLEDKRSPPIRRTVTTWRRSWGKGKVKDGPQTADLLDSDQRIVTHYENDVRHGLYVYTIKGELRESGQFAHDKKEGVWNTFEKRRGMSAHVNWHEGQLHGAANIRYPGGVDRLEFKAGFLTSINEKPVISALLNRVQDGEVRESHVVEELKRESGLILVNTTLAQWLGYTMDFSSNVPLLAAPVLSDMEVSFDARRTMGIDTQSALVVASQRNGFDCDYRYGCLWITTPEDAKDWTDPTGVSGIRLKSGTPLAAAWNEPIKIWQFDEPLAKALERMFIPLAIPVDASQIASTADGSNRFLVKLYLSINGNYLRLRDLLGVLLYKTGCRCELRGDTLIILPQDAAGNAQ